MEKLLAVGDEVFEGSKFFSNKEIKHKVIRVTKTQAILEDGTCLRIKYWFNPNNKRHPVDIVGATG